MIPLYYHTNAITLEGLEDHPLFQKLDIERPYITSHSLMLPLSISELAKNCSESIYHESLIAKHYLRSFNCSCYCYVVIHGVALRHFHTLGRSWVAFVFQYCLRKKYINRIQ